MTSSEIRKSFLSFFKDRGHTVVPSAPVIPYEDPTLLFTNAGMNQFKDVFLGSGKRSYSRAVDTQKCIRVSGKHNDLEEVGRDTYHHTFFEMLGNWSFGDYYKKEAIEWSWELLTTVWGLPKERLWATVYKDDDEAERLWKKVTDINPAHVLRFDEKDNFWEMGETGPCGPCSEIHMDRTAGGSATPDMINAGTADVIEIWNLVFIQYDRDRSGTLTPLPAKHVDTGMGFERLCAVLQNKMSNYDTDVFTPLINAVSKITGKPYDGRMDGSLSPVQKEIDTAMRVVADHVRTLTFAIGDGALPSNEGRGYVLRRILRRAARFGRNLGMHNPFVYELVPMLVDTMSHVFPEIKEKKDHIQQVIKGEEEGFGATLDRGLEIFDDIVKACQRRGSSFIGGNDAFRLYDTFGFPLDLTTLMARERGLEVDEEGFDKLLGEQRSRSRDSAKTVSAPDILKALPPDVSPTVFTGYESFEQEATVKTVSDNLVVLDKTPFYAESGGQVGDTGVLVLGEGAVRVTNTFKAGSIIAHTFEGSLGKATARKVTAKVDKDRRIAIMRNHTATHLVHEALRRVLGSHLHQSGSLVADDHLRFDFNHFDKVVPEKLRAIEDLVNEKIAAGINVHALNDPKEWLTIEEAKKRWPNVKMFFGEKYGERVRVVEIDPAFSVELCGGTHVRNTAEIGFFHFRSEGSVASGIRRIEAVTADHARTLLNLKGKDFQERFAYARQQLDEAFQLHAESAGTEGEKALLQQTEKSLDALAKQRKPVSADFRSFAEAFHGEDGNRHELEQIILKLADARKQLDRALSRRRIESLTSDIDALIRKGTTINGFRLVTAQVTVGTMDELKSLGDTIRLKIGSGVGLLASVVDEKVALVCVVTDDLAASKKLEAGKIVGAVAKLLGGGGGGRPHMATAGAKDVAGLPGALHTVESIIRNFLHTGEHAQ